jgi:succinyl-CoA synthetase alpha subunit
VVLLGEIGGTDEEDAAALLREAHKPVVALLAGRAAPPGVAMGHAGAIVNGRRSSFESKREALVEAGVMVAASPTELALTLSRVVSRQ